MNEPEILIFMSDQHTASIAGFMGDRVVRTPNLDRLAAEGTAFDEAYTSCPLCVPARTSFLTGQYPSRMDVFGNETPFPSDQATFVHSLAARGYETVLCGRMHFVGEDQRHGFAVRTIGDITHSHWGHGHAKRPEGGSFGPAFAAKNCLSIIGKGDSPVLAYDRDVVQSALDYLAEDHHKPQFIVVGTYAPHFPYVGPPELVDYYLNLMEPPAADADTMDYALNAIRHKFDKAPPDDIRLLRATYYAMIENMDAQIGMVRSAWEAYLRRTKRQGIFIYMSDHGDQIGERDLYGKQAFFEYAVKIPLVMQGAGIPAGKRVRDLVSIMDIGPTLCELTQADVPPDQDGRSLADIIAADRGWPERAIFSEFMERDRNGEMLPARMVRQGPWKLISYLGYEEEDLLFQLEDDPLELRNVAAAHPEELAELRERLRADWDAEAQIARAQMKEKHLRLLRKWGRSVVLDNANVWKIPESLRSAPAEMTKRSPK